MHFCGTPIQWEKNFNSPAELKYHRNEKALESISVGLQFSGRKILTLPQNWTAIEMKKF